jgi:hypothetical protein
MLIKNEKEIQIKNPPPWKCAHFSGRVAKRR